MEKTGNDGRRMGFPKATRSCSPGVITAPTYSEMKALHNIRLIILTLAGFAGIGATAQVSNRPPAHRPQHPPPPQSPMNQRSKMAPPEFGVPLPGLSHREQKEFIDGREDFEDTETEASGLGPIFNNVSCAACHSSPVSGGAGPVNTTRFGQMSNGVFNPLSSLGGSLLQDHEINSVLHEVIPPEANVVARRNTTPLFGLGLIEAIPDAQILRNVRRRPVDGVHGKISHVPDPATGKVQIGRFGWKAQQATLLAFAGDAYLNEMGITNRLFPVENAPNGNAQLLSQYDNVADPEDMPDVNGRSDIDRLAGFMRWLGAPPRLPLDHSSTGGRILFQSLGCAVCHVPVMFTGQNRSGALRNKEVWLYSDLLLHDMGALGDGIAQGEAGTAEMKTAPLWGLRASAPYLHDGRAQTVDEAIKAHDGEAKATRQRYERLTPAQVRQLLDFLGTI